MRMAAATRLLLSLLQRSRRCGPAPWQSTSSPCTSAPCLRVKVRSDTYLLGCAVSDAGDVSLLSTPGGWRWRCWAAGGAHRDMPVWRHAAACDGCRATTGQARDVLHGRSDQLHSQPARHANHPHLPRVPGVPLQYVTACATRQLLRASFAETCFLLIGGFISWKARTGHWWCNPAAAGWHGPCG